jgi:hypothetical protein
MSVVATRQRAAHAEENFTGLARVRLPGALTAATAACRNFEAQPSGTLVLRANGVVSPALKDTETIAAFALWTGPGI